MLCIGLSLVHHTLRDQIVIFDLNTNALMTVIHHSFLLPPVPLKHFATIRAKVAEANHHIGDGMCIDGSQDLWLAVHGGENLLIGASRRCGKVKQVDGQ